MEKMNGIKKELREYWNTQGIAYDFGYESDEECAYWRETLRDIIGEKKVRILDVGTGTGFIAMNLATLGHEVTGLDFSEDMMNQARLKMIRRGISWDLIQGDAENPDIPDNSFDCVICRFLLWTLPNPDMALSRWSRIVGPGGKIIIIDGKRPRGRLTTMDRVNSTLWKYSRRFFLGFTGMHGHNLKLEQDLPYSDGIGVDEIRRLLTQNGISHIRMLRLDSLEPIVRKNLPWFLKIGYRSKGVIQVVWGDKESSDDTPQEMAIIPPYSG